MLYIGQCLPLGIDKLTSVYFQARLAQAFGAIGLILFPDPVNLSGPKNARYPQSWEMPAGAIARGSIGNKNGDPLTPLYPAKGKKILSLLFASAKGSFKSTSLAKWHFFKPPPLYPLCHSLESYKLQHETKGDLCLYRATLAY